jgi:hypothetical protein
MNGKIEYDGLEKSDFVFYSLVLNFRRIGKIDFPEGVLCLFDKVKLHQLLEDETAFAIHPVNAV